VQVGHCNASTNGSVLSVCIARFLPNGTPDSSFNGSGQIKATYSGATEFGPVAAALRSDGKLVVAGRCVPGNAGAFCLLRYTPNGALDSGFGNGGFAHGGVFATGGQSTTNMALQADGKIVVVGSCQGPGTSPTYDFCIQRFLPDGGIDTSFNNSASGSIVVDMNGNTDFANAVVVQSDGKIVVVGGCSNGGVYLYCAIRFLAGGGIDSSFGQSGRFIAAASGGAQAVALQPDGKLLLGGQCSHQVGQFTKGDFCVLRISASGALDASFGSNGQVLTTVGSYGNSISSIAVQADGRILLAGRCGNPGGADICVQRLLPEGALDSTFNGSGVVITPIGSGGYYFLYEPRASVALQPDGRIIVGSSCPGGNGDYDFCSVRYDGGPFGHRACTADLDGDGRVLATTDALIVARVALGMTGSAVISGIAFPAEASRTTWSSIRDYLVNQCGMSLP
jgi:uncharacterized delta-60 repeat protein